MPNCFRVVRLSDNHAFAAYPTIQQAMLRVQFSAFACQVQFYFRGEWVAVGGLVREPRPVEA